MFVVGEIPLETPFKMNIEESGLFRGSGQNNMRAKNFVEPTASCPGRTDNKK
jgi:hypothetical protein